MLEREIHVYVEQNLKVSLNESWLRDIAIEALNVEGIDLPVEMGLVITDSETVQQLNSAYRDKDEPTDVLSFPMLPCTGKENEPSFVVPPDGVRHLGEVIISYPKAAQQAQEQGHDLEKELALLTTHGVLHLLGYDHDGLEESRHMRAMEIIILNRFGYLEDEK